MPTTPGFSKRLLIHEIGYVLCGMAVDEMITGFYSLKRVIILSIHSAVLYCLCYSAVNTLTAMEFLRM